MKGLYQIYQVFNSILMQLTLIIVWVWNRSCVTLLQSISIIHVKHLKLDKLQYFLSVISCIHTLAFCQSKWGPPHFFLVPCFLVSLFSPFLSFISFVFLVPIFNFSYSCRTSSLKVILRLGLKFLSGLAFPIFLSLFAFFGFCCLFENLGPNALLHPKFSFPCHFYFICVSFEISKPTRTLGSCP